VSLLAQLRERGLTLSVFGQALTVHPKAAITDELRGVIRQNKPTLLRELAQERTAAIRAARDAADLGTYREAFQAGRLSLCANCAHFAFAADPAALGHCAFTDEETWPFVPMLRCPGFALAAHPAAPDHTPRGSYG
jgi:hypothetical protein